MTSLHAVTKRCAVYYGVVVSDEQVEAVLRDLATQLASMKSTPEIIKCSTEQAHGCSPTQAYLRGFALAVEMVEASVGEVAKVRAGEG